MTQVKETAEANIHSSHEKYAAAENAAYMATSAQVGAREMSMMKDLMKKTGPLPPLPDFEIHKTADTSTSEPGAMLVAKEIGAGITDEVTHHLGRVALNGAEGLLFGAAIGVAATAVLPEAMLLIGICGADYAAIEVSKKVGGWYHDADVVSHQAKFSPAQINDAKIKLREFGAGLTDIAAQFAGGAAASSLVGAFGRDVATSITAPYRKYVAKHSVVAADYGSMPAIVTTFGQLLYHDTTSSAAAGDKKGDARKSATNQTH